MADPREPSKKPRRPAGSRAGLPATRTGRGKKATTAEPLPPHSLDPGESYRVILEMMAQLIFSATITPDHRVIPNWVKGSFEKFGYSEEELVRAPDLRGFVHADDLSHLNEELELALRGQKRISEFRLLAKSGATLWVRGFVRGFLRNTTTGQEFLALGAIWDFTSERQAAEALRESEEKFRILAEESPSMIFINQRGRVVYANRMCSRIMGYSRDEFYSPDFSFLQLIAPESVEYVKKSFRTHMAGGEVEPYDYDLITKDGRRLNSIITTKLVHFGGENAILGIVTDITDRIATERKLRESEQTYRALFEASPDAVLLEDLDGVILDGNSLACQLFGYSREELRGMNARDLATPEARKTFDRLTPEQIVAGGILGEIEACHREGRTFPAEVSTSAATIAGRTVIVVCVRDITLRRQNEADQRQFEQRVQQAQKLESLGVLAGGIAHDFNNLLTGILGFADLALQEMPTGAVGRERVQRIVTAARRAADLTTQMLAYSGKGRVSTRPMVITDLVQEMSNLLEVTISKKNTLKMTFPESLPAVEVDSTQMRQVIMNLILNASEAIGDQAGTITIRAGSGHYEPADLAMGEIQGHLPAGQYVYLEVADTGCGIPPENRAKIFEPFFTTRFTGRGLGLAAVLGIVRAHHGTILVRTTQGQGSSFRVLLPVSSKQPEPVAEAAGIPGKPWRGQGTILVIDDEEEVRDLARAMLERMGFEVVLGRDGEEGLKVFEALAGSVSAVLLDIVMPRLDGRETLKKLRRLDRKVPVILCTGFDEAEATSRLAEKSLAGFIRKPFTYEQLSQVFRQILGSGDPSSSPSGEA